MSIGAILEQLTPILRDTFDDDDLVATPQLAADQVKGWDSLSNVRFFVAVEQAMSVRFTAAEIGGLKNLGELADAIIAKQAAGKRR
ncbi:MAG: acyl carrier protein [Stellaceae bacterium]